MDGFGYYNSVWMGIVFLLLKNDVAGLQGHNVSDVLGHEMTDEQRLICKLLRTVRTEGEPNHPARPVKRAFHPVLLSFGVRLVQIIEFDTKKQIITILVYKDYSWTDELMTWDPDLYGGIQSLILPPTSVWTPDVVLYNSVDGKSVERHLENLIVWYNGTVQWFPSWLYQSHCRVDSTNFPFDQATCIYHFGTWTYTKDQVFTRLSTHDGFNIRDYITSTQWHLAENECYQTEEQYSSKAAKFQILNFRIHIKRKAGFQLKIVIIPSALLPLLTGCMFWIPPGRPDRLGIGVSFFSAFFLLLLILGEYTPSEGKSNLATFCAVNMVMVACAIIASVISVNISYRTTPVPHCVKHIFISWIGKLLCIVPLRLQEPSKTPNHSDGSSDCPSSISTIFTWRTVAAIFDRFVFLLYMIGVFIVFMVSFPRSLGHTS